MNRIRLCGDPLSLEIATRAYKSSYYHIYSESNESSQQYFLVCKDFDGITNPEDFEKVAIKTVDQINAVLSFVKENYVGISYDTFFIGNTGYVFIKDTFSVRDDLCIVENGNIIDPNESEISTISEKILKDSMLENILVLLHKEGISWVNLYRILELFESIKIDVVKKGWVTSENYRRFKHTANSPSVTGNESRHGKQSGLPPVNPMSLTQASILIKAIIWNYINE